LQPVSFVDHSAGTACGAEERAASSTWRRRAKSNWKLFKRPILIGTTALMARIEIRAMILTLRQRNVDATGLDYFKVGVVVTPLMLLAAALTTWLLL
jgi:hypothetical protein